MTTSDQFLWAVRSGDVGQADDIFLKQNRLALGWSEMGDLSKLAPDREAFKERVRQVYTDVKPGAIANYAGQLFRFVHAMKLGELVAFPCKRDRQVHFGRIDGDYQYSPKPNAEYPNHRPVKWIKSVPRTRFSQGALYEAGSAMSVFQIKNFAEEFIAAIDARAAVVPAPVAQDETIAAVAENVDESTQDFIIKTLARETKGHPFAHFVAHLLNTMGYKTRVSPPGSDGGIDIVAHKDELGFEPPIIKVQCKSSEGSIGDPEVSALYGKVGSKEHGLFVALGSFTSKATAFAKSKDNLRLIDGDELVRFIFEHYEQFDSRYKGLLPMRRVYVPESIDEGGD